MYFGRYKHQLPKPFALSKFSILVSLKCWQVNIFEKTLLKEMFEGHVEQLRIPDVENDWP